MSYQLTKVAKSEWGLCNALISVPDEAAQNPGKKYPLIIFFGGTGTAGTDANKLKNDGLTKRIAAGWDTATVNPITGITEKFIVLQGQDGYGSLWPNDMDNVFKYAVLGTLSYKGAVPAGATVFPQGGLGNLVDLDRIVLTGLSAGGTGSILSATWEGKELYTRTKAVMSYAPTVDCNQKNANLPFVASRGVPFWLRTGANDSFLQYANTFAAAYAAAGGNVLNESVAGVAHSGWDNVYNGTVKRPWTYNGVTAQLNVYEWFLAITTPANTQPPIDPEEPEEPETYTPTMERGTWVTLRRVGEPAGTFYRGQVLDFDAETGLYDVFNYGHAVTVQAGPADTPGGTGYYYEAVEPILEPELA